jgi:hypothetical protein
LSSLDELNYFCQFGGHNPSTPRKMRLEELTWQRFLDNHNTSSLWLVCKDCINYFTGGDLTTNVLHKWATEGIADVTNQLPSSLRQNPLRQSLLIQYVDEYLNNNIRKVLGIRFPIFLADSNESEKKYFIQKLEQDLTLRDIFLHDVKDGIERESIALKLWVGATIAAKSTRQKYNASTGGQQEYDLKLRKEGFQEADNYAGKDDVICIGVQVSPILELIIKSHPHISLEGAKFTSPVRRYLKVKDKNNITKEDLDFSINE